MKRFIFYFLLCCCTFLCSCSDELPTPTSGELTSPVSQVEENGILNLPTKEALLGVIEQGTITRGAISRFVENGTFISLLDEIEANASCLKELTEEEKDTILSQHQTYYEVFGYDELVPNENFAKLLNWKGEILVDDSLYRITPIGTFCTSDASSFGSQEIETLYQQILQKDSLSFNDSTCIKLANNVILYNTFPEYKLDETTYETRASSEVPLKHYSSNKSNGWVWQRLASLLGDRSTKHYEYLQKKRVNGSLYDYNYGVYAESGTYVSASRKRGGFFKKINGWFSTLKGASSEIIKRLRKNLHNDKIPDDTKVVRVLTPTKCYTEIIECQTSDSNCSKLRKVFNHSWQFYISNNIISNPASLKSAADFFTNVKSIPVKRITSGRVILLSKIDGAWGGLVIDKDYKGVDEHIYR